MTAIVTQSHGGKDQVWKAKGWVMSNLFLHEKIINHGHQAGIEVITTDAKASKKLKVEKTPKASKNKVFKPEHVTAAPESPASGTQRKTTRKRAADMFDLVEEAVTTAPIKTAHTQTKSTKKSNKAVEALEEALDDFQGFESGNGDDEEEIDTSQLLAGFESSDESGSEADDRGIAVEKLPRPPKANGATVNEAEERRGKAVYAGADEPGTLYIGYVFFFKTITNPCVSTNAA